MAVVPSPAVGRIARLLRAMGAEPQRELSLAELARRSGVPKPTAHSLLLALVAEGFVERTGAVPTYRLGAALAELGDLARGAPTLLDVVTPEVARLHESLGVSVMGAAVEGDEVVVLAAQCVPHPFGYEVVAGARRPLCAPVGPVYVAWSGERDVRRWLDAAPTLTAARRRALARDLAEVRRRGWSATVRARRGDGPTTGSTREATTSDLAAADVEVVGIGAPVRDARDEVVGSIALVGFVDPMPGAQVRGLAAEVVDAAVRASVRLGGGAGRTDVSRPARRRTHDDRRSPHRPR
jgi:DNA-binding IclR family transcriptional regulator